MAQTGSTTEGSQILEWSFEISPRSPNSFRQVILKLADRHASSRRIAASILFLIRSTCAASSVETRHRTSRSPASSTKRLAALLMRMRTSGDAREPTYCSADVCTDALPSNSSSAALAQQDATRRLIRAQVNAFWSSRSLSGRVWVLRCGYGRDYRPSSWRRDAPPFYVVAAAAINSC